MNKKFRYAVFSIVATAIELSAATIQVNVPGDASSATGGSFTYGTMSGDLRGCINYINTQAAGTYNIIFNLTGTGNNVITLAAPLPPINFPIAGISLNTSNVVIDGANTLGETGQVTIDGITGGLRALYAYEGNITVQNITLSGSQIAGNGGSGAGGGAASLGAGLFIDQASVTINNVSFLNNSVSGGNGGPVSSAASSGGGGGGFAGNGGAPGVIAGGNLAGAGGGGGGAPSAVGGNGGASVAPSGEYGGHGGGGGAFGVGGTGGKGAINLSGGGGGGGGFGGTNATGGNGGNGNQGGVDGGSGGSITGAATVNLGGGGGGGGGDGSGGDGGVDSGSSCTGSSNGGGGGGGCSTCTPACASAASASGADGGLGGGGGGAGSGMSNIPGGNGGLGGGGGGGILYGGGGAGGYLAGGGGGGNSGSSASSAGGFGGGGGGTAYEGTLNAGDGGFGGGGGGAATSGVHASGNGGFGAGGGGLNTNTSATTGTSGAGGGIPSTNASLSGGGGGAGFGSAIFLNNGGSLSIQTNSQTSGFTAATSTSGSVAMPGAGAGASSSGYTASHSGATVQEIFAMSGETITFSAVNAIDVVTIAAAIADDSLNSIPSSTTYVSGSGTGASVNITGLGTVVFQGNSSYGGPSSTTTITSGTLNIASDASLGGSSVPLIFAGSSTLQAGGSILYSVRPLIIQSGAEAIFDTNSFNLANTGTITMGSGSSSLTKISSGTLSLGGDITTGSVTVSGGTLTLSGDNSYTNVTTINASSILQAGGANSFSSVSRHLLNDTAILDLNGINQTIGSLDSDSGSASVTLSSATLTTGGDNSDSTYAGAINGSGGLTFIGTGSMNLTGTSTYTGYTNVESGTVKVNGTLASPMNVYSGATLSGAGTIQNSVFVNGSITPGNSIGTISVDSLVLSSSAMTNIELAPGNNNNSEIVVSGNAILDGSLNLTFDSGAYLNTQSYTLVETTGTLNGTFNAVNMTNFPTGFIGQLIYNANSSQFLLANANTIGSSYFLSGNELTLLNYLKKFSNNSALQPILLDLSQMTEAQLTASLDSISPARNGSANYTAAQIAFGVGEVSINRMTTAKILRGMSKKSLQSIAAALLEKTECLSAMEKESMGLNTPVDLVVDNEFDQTQQRPAAGSPIRLAAEKDRYVVWESGFGSFIQQKAQNQNPTIKGSGGGGLIGFDYFGLENGDLTLSGGYVHTNITEEGHAGKGNSNGGVISVYGTGYINDGYIAAGILGGYNRYDMSRSIAVEGTTPFEAVAKSSFNVWQCMPHLAAGYDWMFDWGVVEQFASFDWVCNFQQSYKENGAAPLNMSVKGSAPSMLRSQIGFNIYESWNTSSFICILEESISYVNKALFNMNVKTSLLLPAPSSGAAGPIYLQSYDQTLNLASWGVNCFYKHKRNGFFASIAYQGEAGTSYVSQDIQLILGLFF